MSGASHPAIYPRCCFHLSPTFNVWCLLSAAEIQRLEQHAGFEGQNFYFYKNLPIRWARLVGVVVAIDEIVGRRIFTIDDSSGVCIEAITTYTSPSMTGNTGGTAQKSVAEATAQAHDQNATEAGKKATEQNLSPPFDEMDVGSVVDVKGKLTTFRDEMQIKIEKMVSLKCTAQEVALWEKRSKFRREVLGTPWVLREKDIRRCQRQAERSEEQAERKKKCIQVASGKPSFQHPVRPKEAPRKEKPSTAPRTADLEDIIRGSARGQYNALGL